MNMFRKAKLSQQKGMGYRYRNFKLLWKNKQISWNWFAIEYGIRWSDSWQIFPIWNGSHNGQRSLIFGFWKVYFQITYHRKKSFDQTKKRFMQNQFRKFYQLIN